MCGHSIGRGPWVFAIVLAVIAGGCGQPAIDEGPENLACIHFLVCSVMC